MITDYSKIIPPKEWKKILPKIKRLDVLIKQIDQNYASGRFRNIDKMEVEAERLEEELSALYDVYSDASDAPWFVGDGHSLSELLIMTYLTPKDFSDRTGWLENMKENVRLMIEPYNPRLPISDDQILEIAQDAVTQRQALIQKYKAPRKQGLKWDRRKSVLSGSAPKLLAFEQLPEQQRGEVLDHISAGKAVWTKWKLRMVDPEFVYYQYGLPQVYMDQVKILMETIEREGFTVPITVDGIDGWMEGNHRARAAIHLKLKEIPAYTRES